MENVTVFISSTYEDLKDYRKAVQEVLHKLKTIVHGMEYFVSKHETPKDECLKIVRESQVYIGIFAMRYGSVDSETQMSLTHLEYLEAQKNGLKSLIYIIDEDNQPVLPKYFDTGSDAEKLKEFKTELKKKLVSFFTTPDDLAKKVSQDLPPLLKTIGIDVGAEKKEDGKLIEQKEAAELRWQYIQDHPITGITIEFILKTSVGHNWLVKLFDKTHIWFSRDKNSIGLGDVLKNSPKPNTEDSNRKNKKPISSFWEIYDKEEGFWCKRINTKGFDNNLVAGFEAHIPWSYCKFSGIKKLKDLAICDDIGISFPPTIFQVGFEDIRLDISGETFSFSTDFAESMGIAELAKTFFSMDLDFGKSPLNFALSTNGVQLLNKFHKQMMPDYKPSSKRSPLSQLSISGKSISFYPSIPKTFNNSEEHKDFTFTIPGHSYVDYNKLEQEYMQDLQANDNSLENYTKLAKVYMAQRRFQDVIILLNKAKNRNLFSRDLHWIFGHAYTSIGRYSEAISELKIAYLLFTDQKEIQAEIQANIGMCLLELDDNQSAIEYFVTATKLDPNCAKYQYLLSLTLARLNNIDDAILSAKHALDLSPDDIDYILLLSRIFFVSEQYDAALELAKRALDLDDKRPLSYHLYAKILTANGMNDDAISNYKKSLKIEKDISCYADYARLLCHLLQLDDAESLIKEGLEIDPNHYELIIYLGIVKANRGDYEEALKLLRKAKSINPNDNTADEYIKQIKKDSSSVKKKTKNE